MSMSKELAMTLAQHEAQGQPLNVQMRKANAIFKANNDNDWQTPFPQVDVAFATFVDFMRSDCTQRERDLVYTSEKLQRVWKTLHISMQTMGEQPTSYDEAEITALVAALARLTLLPLLTEGLRPDLCQWVQELADTHGKPQEAGTMSDEAVDAAQPTP